MRTLFCFYDMSVSPCSYDFFVFLYSAEVSRIRRKLEKLKLILIHGPKGLFRHDNIRTHDQNLNFFHNVVIPGISLIPSCDSFLWSFYIYMGIEFQKNALKFLLQFARVRAVH